ncbi:MULTISPECIES: hypothetical protein [Brevibacterium]|uniref:Uncharacterized protein n=2 Tax=Brevibacterium TaxID=1696 RepID=A0A2N6PHZ2_9MICO|nr:MULTISPECIES: hypothetical protein [Brevibacterium]MBD8019938.1 hypothetical protein [Brevibacterium gallinarum]MCT1657433.1 hypothetical protein [Brevibacterium luteolum]MCT1829559.1 hypothetical protein [Brevibacterium luteolum]MCT1873561.1 hypothetical protein [Brevibacterium luteolum]MCT1889844.1 hypothetical protein [Brevibacterium luteolum]
MKIGYALSIVLSVLGLAVLFGDGFGLTEHSFEAALGLIVVSLMLTFWQRSRDRRDPQRHPRPGDQAA